jgi:hypothetical protein
MSYLPTKEELLDLRGFQIWNRAKKIWAEGYVNALLSETTPRDIHPVIPYDKKAYTFYFGSYDVVFLPLENEICLKWIGGNRDTIPTPLQTQEDWEKALRICLTIFYTYECWSNLNFSLRKNIEIPLALYNGDVEAWQQVMSGLNLSEVWESIRFYLNPNVTGDKTIYERAKVEILKYKSAAEVLALLYEEIKPSVAFDSDIQEILSWDLDLMTYVAGTACNLRISNQGDLLATLPLKK